LVPISVQATDESYDIYGEKIDSAALQAIGETVELYEASSNSAAAEVIGEPFGIYEDWRSPYIRSDRWIVRTDRAHEARREVVGYHLFPYGHHLLMRYRLGGQTSSNSGLVGAMQAFRVSNPSAINKIKVKFEVKDSDVIGCEANSLATRIRPAAISLDTFNDGSSTGPSDLTGEHFVRVMVNREAFTTDPRGMLTVAAFLFRCIDAVCSNAYSTVFNLDFGKVWVGIPFSLRVSWDESNHRFLVGYNHSPDVILAYNPSLNAKPPVGPIADFHIQLVNANCEAGPTVTDAETEVREVYTNVSAIIP
jgi:hypothetical protein